MTLGLNGVQKVRDGEPLAGIRVTAESAFSAVTPDAAPAYGSPALSAPSGGYPMQAGYQPAPSQNLPQTASAAPQQGYPAAVPQGYPPQTPQQGYSPQSPAPQPGFPTAAPQTTPQSAPQGYGNYPPQSAPQGYGNYPPQSAPGQPPMYVDTGTGEVLTGYPAQGYAPSGYPTQGV